MLRSFEEQNLDFSNTTGPQSSVFHRTAWLHVYRPAAYICTSTILRLYSAPVDSRSQPLSTPLCLHACSPSLPLHTFSSLYTPPVLVATPTIWLQCFSAPTRYTLTAVRLRPASVPTYVLASTPTACLQVHKLQTFAPSHPYICSTPSNFHTCMPPRLQANSIPAKFQATIPPRLYVSTPASYLHIDTPPRPYTCSAP